jgi:hypothetical protein
VLARDVQAWRAQRLIEARFIGTSAHLLDRTASTWRATLLPARGCWNACTNWGAECR